MISDTHPDVEEVQIRLMRQMTCADRFDLVCSLTDAAVQLAKRAIERANPGISQRDRDLLFIEVHYGRELAGAVRDYWKGQIS